MYIVRQWRYLYFSAAVLLELLLDQYKNDQEKHPHLDPEQLDKNGDCIFHLIAKAKFTSYILKLTEMLCKRNLSADYYNKDGKLPINYITKKNDRRLQYFRLARSVKRSREQIHGPKSPKKGCNSGHIDDELHQLPRPADSEVIEQTVTEVAKALSLKDRRKRNIEELITLLPDSKHSIFKVDHSPGKKTMFEEVREEGTGTVEKFGSDHPCDKRSKIVDSVADVDKYKVVGVQRDVITEVMKLDKGKINAPEKLSLGHQIVTNSQNDGEKGSQEVVDKLSSRMCEKLNSVAKRTLEDVAANLILKPKQSYEAVENDYKIDQFVEGNGTSVDEKISGQFADSGPPSLEKDGEIRKDDTALMNESIDDDFYDAVETVSQMDVTVKEEEDSVAYEDGHESISATNGKAGNGCVVNVTTNTPEIKPIGGEVNLPEKSEVKIETEKMENDFEKKIAPIEIKTEILAEAEVVQIPPEEMGQDREINEVEREDTDDEEDDEDFEIDVQVSCSETL